MQRAPARKLPLLSRRGRGWLCALGLALGPGLSAADEPGSPGFGPRAIELSSAAFALTHASFFRTAPLGYGVEVAAQVPIARLPGTFYGGGLRGAAIARTPAAAPSLPLELFAQAGLSASLGFWRPLAAVELGFSGLGDLGWARGALPGDLYELEQARVAPLYLAFRASALRVAVGAGWTVSALELSVGTTLVPLGAAGRIQISLLRVGGTL